MAKLTLSDFTSFASDPSAPTTQNNNNTAIETAVENTLSRDGTSPNEMGAELDMNSYKIVNLPAALTNTEPVRLREFNILAGEVDAIDGQNSILAPNYETWADVEEDEILPTVGAIYVFGRTIAGKGGALFVRTNHAPWHNVFIRSVDRYRLDGVIDGTNGGYWVPASNEISLETCGAIEGKDCFDALTDGMSFVTGTGAPSDVTLGNNPIATTINSSTVVITESAHTRKVGDVIQLNGASSVGGFRTSGIFSITAVTTNTWSVDMLSQATSTATGGGASVLVKVALGGTLIVPTGYWPVSDQVSLSFDGGITFSLKGMGRMSRLVSRNAEGILDLTSASARTPFTLRDISLEPGLNHSGDALTYTMPVGSVQNDRTFQAINVNMVPLLAGNPWSFDNGIKIVGGYRTLFSNVVHLQGNNSTTRMGYIFDVSTCYAREFYFCYANGDAVYGFVSNSLEGNPEGFWMAHCISTGPAIGLSLINSNEDFWHQDVRVATTTSGTLASSFENGDTIDGIVLATNDRILIKNQTDAKENGIYYVNASGAPTRAVDADQNLELFHAAVHVTVGTVNANTNWYCSNVTVPIIGTDNITFATATPTSESQPGIIVYNTQFNCNRAGVYIDGAKFGYFIGNLMYAHNPEASEPYSDFYIAHGVGHKFSGNTYGLDTNQNRRLINLNPRPSGTVNDIYIEEELFEGGSDLSPFYVGPGVNRVEMRLPAVPPASSTYPTELVEVDATADDVHITTVRSYTNKNDTAAEDFDYQLRRDSATPADNDVGASLGWYFRNDASPQEWWRAGAIVPVALDVSNGTEDGELLLKHMLAGSEVPAMIIGQNCFAIIDGITAPSTVSGRAYIYVDVADGDLKIKYGDGTVKTIVVDT